MEKRSLIAIALCFLVLAVYQMYFLPPPPAQTEAEKAGTPALVFTEDSEIPANPVQQKAPQATQAATAPAANTTASPATTPVTNVSAGPVVAGELAANMVVWDYQSDTGIQTWQFDDYHTEVDGSERVEFFQLTGPGAGLPGLSFAQARQSRSDYRPYGQQIRNVAPDGSALVLRTPAEHRFVVEPAAARVGESYRMELTLRKEFDSAGGFGAAYQSQGLVFRTGAEVERIDIADLEEGYRLDSGFDWVGLEDKYFLLIFQPGENGNLKLRAYSDTTEEGRVLVTLELVYSVEAEAGFEGQVLAGLEGYAGPKDTRKLREIDPSMTQLVDFGFFAVVARPMLAILHIIHDVLGNWGVAIILLTLLVKSLLFPLQVKFTESMYRMQALKPKMEQLKEKFNDDKMRLNQEMADLYKREGVNPLGGCLPMVMQIPIFFALYNVFLSAIELRHAPFFGWVQDLSQPEALFTIELGGFDLPFRLLPILMAASSYLQMRITPTSVDNEQQKIMMTWMPVIFTVFMYSFPSGLVIYWLTQNLLTVAQNMVIRRRMAAKGLLPNA